MARTRTVRKPISPAQHGLLDYGLAAAHLVVPRLLGTSGRARAVFAGFGLALGAVDALTAQPYALRPVLPLEVHRRIDLGSAPAFLAVPLLTGVAKEPRARAWWLVAAAALLTTYALTDWSASPRARRR
jgi:hypothetical protein